MQLRDYQRDCVNAVFSHLDAGATPLAHIGTGGGKSLICAAIAKRWLSHQNRLVIILVPSKELVKQNCEALTAFELTYGVVCASLGAKHTGDVTVATPRSQLNMLAGNRAQYGESETLVIVDEAHLIPPDMQTTYQRLIATIADLWPKSYLCGLTGTPFRGDGLPIYGEGKLFDSLVFSKSVYDLTRDGYLVPLRYITPDVVIGDEDLTKTGGEYTASSIAEAIDKDGRLIRILNQVLRIKDHYNRIMLFAPTVHSAYAMADYLERNGMSVAAITGETTQTERDALVTAFKCKQLHCIVSVAALLTGFDAPAVDLMVVLRNTASPVLYCQLMGRGVRRAPGKERCDVLDFTDNLERLGPSELVGLTLPDGLCYRVDWEDERDSEAQVSYKTRICPKCGHTHRLHAKSCPRCRFAYPVAKLRDEAATLRTVKADAPKGKLARNMPEVLSALGGIAAGLVDSLKLCDPALDASTVVKMPKHVVSGVSYKAKRCGSSYYDWTMELSVTVEGLRYPVRLNTSTPFAKAFLCGLTCGQVQGWRSAKDLREQLDKAKRHGAFVLPAAIYYDRIKRTIAAVGWTGNKAAEMKNAVDSINGNVKAYKD